MPRPGLCFLRKREPLFARLRAIAMRHSLLLDDGAKWCALALTYAALLTAGTPERAACFGNEHF
jgi:hypothetical protein